MDNPVAIAESKNTGIAYDSIIVFELKRPMRDDYDMENNPIMQLIDYCYVMPWPKATVSRGVPTVSATLI